MTMAKKAAKPPMLHRGQLRERGWTEKLMRCFLGEPDGTRANPMYRSSAPVPLWLESRIVAIEASGEFKDALAAAAKRKASAARAVETKLAAMDAWIDGLEVELPDIDDGELVRLACRHYNNRQIDMMCDGRIGGFMEATPESNPKFLERIQVNFIRHCGTDYESLLDETFGRAGACRAYGRIRAKVLDAIAGRYPRLRDECERQKQQ